MAVKKGKREMQDRGKRIRRRILVGLAVVAVLFMGGYVALSRWIQPPEIPVLPLEEKSEGGSVIQESTNLADLPETPLEQWETEIPRSAQSGQREGVYTFLLVGQDTVGGLTDTIILVTYDSKEKTVHGISLPRDTMVNVRASSKKLNAIYNYNKGTNKDTQVEKGMAALKKEVSKLTGIIPNFYVLVQWNAVGELVDALGGVWFEVPYDMNYDDPYQNLHIHQKAGYRKLTGSDAMQVVRHRKNNDGSHSQGDVGRIAVQQDFLKAVARQCLQPAVLLKAPALAQVFLNNVETDLKIGNLLYFAQSASGMDPDEDVTLVTMPYVDALYPTTSMVLPIRSQLLKLLNDGINPYLSEINSSDLQIIYRNSDGSYGVTSGALADASLSRPYTPSSSSESRQEETASAAGESDAETEAETETETEAGTQTGEGSASVPGSSRESGAETPGHTDSDTPEALTGEETRETPEAIEGTQTQSPEDQETGMPGESEEEGETQVPDEASNQEEETPEDVTQEPQGESPEEPEPSQEAASEPEEPSQPSVPEAPPELSEPTPVPEPEPVPESVSEPPAPAEADVPVSE